MQASTHVKFRITILFFAALLGLQSIWLTLAELSRGGVDRLPTDLSAAAAAAARRDRAARAAEIGAIRGELWAQSAFTYADLLLGEHEETAEVMQKLTRARVSLERALKDAPTQSGAWLLRAGLGLRYPSLGFDAIESLKMSYYTGPSEQDLIPLRLRLTALSNAIGDVEIREFVAAGSSPAPSPKAAICNSRRLQRRLAACKAFHRGDCRGHRPPRGRIAPKRRAKATPTRLNA